MSATEHTPPQLVVLGEWVARANCLGVDPDLFFTERGESTKEAKAVCAGCMVRIACLDHAMEVPERFGIWGGLSERERRRHRRVLITARRQIEMGAL